MFVIFHVNVHKACLFCEAQACWSCCKNESQKGAGPWTRRAQTRSSARLFVSETSSSSFFPASSIHKSYSKKPPRSMSQSPPARNYPTPKKEFVDPARHLLVSALAQRDPQAPDASVESAKARIFSPRLRSKSQGLSAHRLAAAFVRKPPFPFLFFGSAQAIFSWIGEKENTRQCFA